MSRRSSSTTLSRRAFLRGLAGAPVWATLGGASCTGPDLARFPQGVASGDPRPGEVTLWTRVAADAGDDDVSVELVVSRDELGWDVVARASLVARAADDHCVKTKVKGLDAGTRYFYRFAVNGAQSIVGRTRTARAKDDDAPVRFALATCQDYVGRSFAAWQRLHDEDLDFVLFLGDWIYEYESGSNASFVPMGPRRAPLPDGIVVKEDGDRVVRAANTLLDYRTLYRAVGADPLLMRARQLHPFVVMWDDHEFANDAWRDVANDFAGAPDEVSPARRAAATRAWLEHLPIDLARDADAAFPDDVKTFRSFRFGRHVELFLTDQRNYRDDHLIPEGPADDGVGKFLANSPVGSRTFVKKSGFDAREAAAQPTMLGADQKRWLMDGAAGSDATWKVVGSQTMMAQLLLDVREVDVPTDFKDVWYFKLDQWDGYRTERAEVLASLDAVDDVVVLSGDLHGFYAGALHVDFDAQGARPAAVEVVTTGVSASPVAEQLASALDDNPLLAAFGLETVIRALDDIVLNSNPHLSVSRSWAIGLSIATVDAGALAVELIEIPDELALRPQAERRTRLVVDRGTRALRRLDD